MTNSLANFDWITISVLVLLIALWARFFYKRGKKELSYEISSVPFVSHSSEISGKLELLWNGAEMENVQVVKLEIMNTGNVTLKQTDFARDFAVNFDVKSNVIEIDLLSTKPYTMYPEIINHVNSIALKPIQMNPGDSIRIKSLVHSPKKDFSVDFNLKGDGTVKNYITTHFLSDKDKGLLIVYAIVATLFSIFLSIYNLNALPKICIILLTVMNINAMYFVYRILLKYK